MKLTPWMLTVASFLVIALLAVGFLFKKLTAREEVVAARPEARTLPMAVTDIEPGTVITRSHIGNGPWKDNDLSSDTFLNYESVLGRIARERITAAQPLRGSQFYAPGDHPDLKVGENMRAVTINVGDDTAMVNGLIKPGQYVDVNLTVDQTSGDARGRLRGTDAMTLTLFEGVRVVAMNRSYSQSTVDRGHNVTLELDEVQSRIVMLASQKGTVALAFNPNGPGDGGVHISNDEDRVTLQQILGVKEEKEKEKPFMTEHYRGGGHSTTYFEDGRRVNYVGGSDDSGNDATPLHGGNDDWGFSTKNDSIKRDSAVQPKSADEPGSSVTQKKTVTAL